MKRKIDANIVSPHWRIQADRDIIVAYDEKQANQIVESLSAIKRKAQASVGRTRKFCVEITLKDPHDPEDERGKQNH